MMCFQIYAITNERKIYTKILHDSIHHLMVYGACKFNHFSTYDYSER